MYTIRKFEMHKKMYKYAKIYEGNIKIFLFYGESNLSLLLIFYYGLSTDLEVDLFLIFICFFFTGFCKNLFIT